MPDRPPSRTQDTLAEAFSKAAYLASAVDTGPALDAFRDIVRRWPGLAIGWANLGVLLKRSGHLVDAVAAFDRAARLAPQDPHRHEALASAAHEAGDMRRTARAIRCQILLDPSDADASYNLALILPLIGPRDRGLVWMRRTARLAPSRSGVWDRLGRIAAAHGVDLEADRAFRRALCLDPAHVDVLTDMARRWTSIVTLARLFCRDPSDDVVRIDLASARWHDDDREGCRDLLAVFLDRAGVPDRAVRIGRIAGLREFDARQTRYERWLALYERPLDRDRDVPKDGPLISLIMPVYNPPADVLAAAIASVECQSYPGWQFCICDDASSDPDVIAVLDAASARDPRIRLVRRHENGHISQASNDALDRAEGEFVTFLDHDDALPVDALAWVVLALSDGDADILYSDEDKIDESGQRFDAFFKPDWDPDRMMYQNVVTHLAVYRRSLVERVGRLRIGVEGSQDHDLVLRVSEITTPERIRHIPRILYHWRAIAGSTSVSIAAKPYAVAATHRVIGDHLTRLGLPARVQAHTYGHRVVWDLPAPAPAVGVVIATRDQPSLLRRCLDGLLAATDYPSLSVVVVDNGSVQPATRGYLEQIAIDPRVTVMECAGAFNFSALMNAGAAAVQGEVLLFLNDDIEVMHADWLRELVSHAVRPDVGPVGAKLLYPSMTVQHGGVVLAGEHGSRHLDVGLSDRSPSYLSRARVVQSVAAVTGACLAIRRAVFDGLGGFDAANLAIDFADTDLCLRAARAGRRTIWTPFARLLHHESASRGAHLSSDKRARFEAERDVFVARWGDQLDRDRWYNVNLAVAPGTRTFDLAFPPRK